MINLEYIAPIYDGLVKLIFGNSLSNATNYFLSRVPPQSKILIVGGGTGQLLEVLNESASGSHVTFLDVAPAMITRAKKRNYAKLSVDFINKSVFEFNDFGYDIVITPFFLDLFVSQELNLIGNKLTGALKKGGYWLFSDFVTSGSIYHFYLIKLLYLCYRIVYKVSARELPEYDSFFKNNSMNLISRVIISNGLIESRVYRHL